LRSRETASLIADYHSLSVAVVSEFNEIDHGSWEGKHLETVINEHGDLYEMWLNEPHNAKMPGGEDLQDIRDRAVRKLSDILATTPDGSTVLIAGHDATNKVILCYALGLDNSHFWQIKQGNASISVLEYENEVFHLTLLNDTCHMGGVLDDTTMGAL
jgi:probable phosphoglycerate mutase